MTGNEVIERLNKLVGKRCSLSVNGVIWNGVLRGEGKSIISAIYNAGDVVFIVFSDKNYDFELDDKRVRIREAM